MRGIEQLPIPSTAVSDDLWEVLTDLYEVDGYVMGFAYSVLGGQRRFPDAATVTDLLARLDQLPDLPEDRENVQDVRTYLRQLELLCEMMSGTRRARDGRS